MTAAKHSKKHKRKRACGLSDSFNRGIEQLLTQANTGGKSDNDLSNHHN